MFCNVVLSILNLNFELPKVTFFIFSLGFGAFETDRNEYRTYRELDFFGWQQFNVLIYSVFECLPCRNCFISVSLFSVEVFCLLFLATRKCRVESFQVRSIWNL